jgi:hypothetical protein
MLKSSASVTILSGDGGRTKPQVKSLFVLFVDKSTIFELRPVL